MRPASLARLPALLLLLAICGTAPIVLFPAPALAQSAATVTILPNNVHPEWPEIFRAYLISQGWPNVAIGGREYSGVYSRLYCRVQTAPACGEVRAMLEQMTTKPQKPPRPLPAGWSGDIIVALGDDLAGFFTTITSGEGFKARTREKPKEAPPKPKVVARKPPAHLSKKRFDERIAYTFSAGAGHLYPTFGAAFELEIRPFTAFFGLGKWISPVLEEKGNIPIYPNPKPEGYGFSVGGGYYYWGWPMPDGLQAYAFLLYGTARKLIDFPDAKGKLTTFTMNEPSVLLGLRYYPWSAIPLFVRMGGGLQLLDSAIYGRPVGMALDFGIGMTVPNPGGTGAAPPTKRPPGRR
ncbi:MAG: hypothetical protein HYY13_01240 [Nitrospirae bacterium]|nr:hypothetical protein [Nitrospirota bacterium]